MNKVFRKPMMILAAVCLLWVGATSIGYADLRIVQEAEGHRQETLFKQNRMVQPMPDGGKTVLFCETGQLAIVSSKDVGRYWQGDFSAFLAMSDNLLGEDDEGSNGLAELGGLLGSLFGGNAEPEELAVRVTKSGEDTVSGYAAERYIVETGRGNNWKTYEELWISADLMKEIKAEIGSCVDMMVDFVSNMPSIGALGGLLGMDEMEAVLASPDYLSLLKQGHPVRTKTTVRGLFGQTSQTVTEIVEVSSESIAEDVFNVPAAYQRVDSFMEVYGM